MIGNLIVEDEYLDGDNRLQRSIYNSNYELLIRLVFKKSSTTSCCKCQIKKVLDNLNHVRSPHYSLSEHDLCLLCCTAPGEVGSYLPDLEEMGMKNIELVHIFREGVVKKKARRNESKKDTHREG